MTEIEESKAGDERPDLGLSRKLPVGFRLGFSRQTAPESRSEFGSLFRPCSPLFIRHEELRSACSEHIAGN